MPDEVVLISGASSDIARPLLASLANRPGRKICLAHRSQPGEAVAQTPDLEWVRADLAVEADRTRVADLIYERGVSHFVHLHGDGHPEQPLHELSLSDFERLLALNYTSVLFLVQAMLPGMIERDFGRMIFTGTASASHGGGPTSFSYGFAKHGLEYLTLHVAKYYARHNILANCVAPGFIQTRFHTERMGKDPVSLAERGKTVRVGRTGTPADVAGMIAQLAFQNEFITGQIVTVDGGDFL